MIVFTPIFESNPKEQILCPKYDGVKMSLEEYYNSNFEESGFKYEWNDGVLEAEEKLKPSEAIIYSNLHTKFIEKNFLRDEFEMISEMECYLATRNKVRIPDIGIFSKQDIRNYKKGNSFIPVLAIEIISPSNQMEEMELKIKDYFQDDVKSVWCIFPRLKEVRIYTSPKLVKICTDHDICDAGEAIPDFQISVSEIF